MSSIWQEAKIVVQLYKHPLNSTVYPLHDGFDVENYFRNIFISVPKFEFIFFRNEQNSEFNFANFIVFKVKVK